MRAGYFPWMLVESWLHRAARTRPNAIALRAEDGVLRYAELLEAATLVAQRLSALGVVPGALSRCATSVAASSSSA